MNINQTVKQAELIREGATLEVYDDEIYKVESSIKNIYLPKDNVKKIKAIDERIEEINTILKEGNNG